MYWHLFNCIVLLNHQTEVNFMKIVKKITLDFDQYSLIQRCLDNKIIVLKDINDKNEYDEEISQLQKIIDLISNAKSKVV